MKKIFTTLLFLSTLCFSSGCLIANAQYPLDTDFEETELCSKKGESYSQSILFGLVTWGDAGAHAAAKNGNLKVMKHADVRVLNILWLYSRITTVIYGD